MSSAARRFALVLSLIAVTVVDSTALADRIILSGGGEIHGMLVNDDGKSETVQILTARSQSPLVLPRSAVARFVDQEDIFDAYQKQREACDQTGPGFQKLGLWCDSNGLTGPAQTHYQKAVELDPTLAESHKKLGHVLHEGVWMTYAQRSESQGLVQREGKWIAPETNQRLADRDAFRQAREGWVRQIRVLLDQYRSGSLDQSAEARSRLQEILDPPAVAALVDVLSRGGEAEHTLLVDLMETNPASEARDILVGQVLQDPFVRAQSAALDALRRRNEPDTPGRFLQALRSSDAAIVGRAARALAQLGARSAVPQLVAALVRNEKRQVWIRNTGRPVGPGAPTSGFTGIAGQDYVANIEPVVGPGVVAYRPIIGTMGSGVSTSSPSPASAGPPIPQIVTVPVPNPEVLASLELLTGRNFGYDRNAWQRWIRSSFRIETEPARRVAEP